MNTAQPDPSSAPRPDSAKPLIQNETILTKTKNSGKQTDQTGKTRLVAWCLYDAGSTAFSTVIVTFVYAVYFARSIYGDPVRGSAVWSYALAAAGLVIALLAPLLGAAEDHYGAGRRFLRGFALFCIGIVAALYLIPPAAGPVGIAAALGLVAAGSVALELSLVFSNALLPLLAPPAGWGGCRAGRGRAAMPAGWSVSVSRCSG